MGNKSFSRQWFHSKASVRSVRGLARAPVSGARVHRAHVVPLPQPRGASPREEQPGLGRPAALRARAPHRHRHVAGEDILQTKKEPFSNGHLLADLFPLCMFLFRMWSCMNGFQLFCKSEFPDTKARVLHTRQKTVRCTVALKRGFHEKFS